MNSLQRIINEIDKLIENGEFPKAKKYLDHLNKEYQKTDIIRLNKVSFLIDIGEGMGDPEITKKGIDEGEKLLKLRNAYYHNNKAFLYYCIANGYLSLYRLHYNKSDIKQIVDNSNLQNAKSNFRNAIKEINTLNSIHKRLLWTNFGNCMDELGRSVEALHAYDEALKIDPNFAMALGNKAEAILSFANISGAYTEAMYIESYQMLKLALKSGDLVTFGGIPAKNNFEEKVRQIEELIKDKNILLRNLTHPKYDSSNMTDFEKFYVDFCSKHKLFLNFHIHIDDCEASIVDPIFIKLIIPAGNDQTFYNLAKYINQIKEDYIIARLLLVQSLYKREDFNHISKRTTFVNSLDYSIFNIYIGLLKSAFKEAYSILDKISRFLNEYYDLGVKDRIYFTTIWQYKVNKNERKIRPKILNSKNISLYALYDIFLDFRSDYYKNIQDIRNASVHERLMIHDSTMTDWDNKEDKYNIGYNTMLSETINLLQLVKSAIIYLINFVNLEENRKKKKFKTNIIEKRANTDQLFAF